MLSMKIRTVINAYNQKCSYEDKLWHAPNDREAGVYKSLLIAKDSEWSKEFDKLNEAERRTFWEAVSAD